MKEKKIKKEIKKEAEYAKTFMKCGILGGAFGLVFIIFIFIIGVENGFSKLSIGLSIGVSFLCGIISGIGGLMGEFLNNFLREKGVNNKLKRDLLSVLITMILFAAIIIIFFQLNPNLLAGLTAINQNMLWGFSFGGIFALIVVIIDYYFWKNKKRCWSYNWKKNI